MIFLFSVLVLALSVMFGGGTHSGYLGDVVIQLSAIPLFIAALASAWRKQKQETEPARLGLLFCCMMILVFAAQLMPWPYDFWPKTSPLSPFGETLSQAGQPIHWSILSLTPQATWAAAASFIAPLSIFTASTQLTLNQRLTLCWCVLGLGALSLTLGFLQIAEGPHSALRFYDFTNPDEAVGFFANRNHFAALLNITLVLAALYFAQQTIQKSQKSARSLLWLCLVAACLIAVVAGLAVTRSRAGLLIAILALTGIVIMIGLQSKHGRTLFSIERFKQKGFKSQNVMIMLVICALVFSAQVGLERVMSRFQQSVSDDLRGPLNETTFEAAFKALPFGTGIGSFVPVYATAEKKADVFAGYANRAHNDFAEIWLETGAAGMALCAIFGAWFLRCFYRAWFRRGGSSSATQRTLERAATLIILLLLAHSAVDYPLRTAALSSLFAFFCALLTFPAPEPAQANVSGSDGNPQAQSTSPRAQTSAWEKWEGEAAWPASWQKE